MENNVLSLFDYLSRIADVSGIISFLLGIVTLCMTVGIKKSLLKHIEKSDYLKDIDMQIAQLDSFYNTLLKDPTLYNEMLLQEIDGQLEEIQVNYETILPKKLLNSITKLRNHIKNKCTKQIRDKAIKRECMNQLHSICLRLKKEKKVL